MLIKAYAANALKAGEKVHVLLNARNVPSNNSSDYPG
jgi:hypothetical protein